jgi:hypothetical protein
METILNYLRQNSTWRGLIGLATAAGIMISPELSEAIIAAGMGAIGVINVVRDEKKKKKK